MNCNNDMPILIFAQHITMLSSPYFEDRCSSSLGTKKVSPKLLQGFKKVSLVRNFISFCVSFVLLKFLFPRCHSISFLLFYSGVITIVFIKDNLIQQYKGKAELIRYILYLIAICIPICFYLASSSKTLSYSK